MSNTALVGFDLMELAPAWSSPIRASGSLFSGRRRDKSRSPEARAESIYRKQVRREKYGKATR